MHTIDSGNYEWDSDKAIDNLCRHGVSFADAMFAMDDAHRSTRHDPDSNGEPRYISMGRDPLGRVLVIVFTHREPKIRLISARKASAAERRLYTQR